MGTIRSQNGTQNIISGDNRGYVYDDGQTIKRVTYDADSNHSEYIYSLYQKYALNSFGVVGTSLEQDVLSHQKLPITYPHEWPPALFKDAVLFHLHLLLQLNRYGLTLKDAMPENILFTGTTPAFVDFFSLLPADELDNEQWLKDYCPKGLDLRLHVLERMFVPYMLIPLLMYAAGRYDKGQRLLKNCYCNNCRGEVAGWDALRHLISPSKKKLLKMALSAERLPRLAAFWKMREIHKLCGEKFDISWEDRLRELIRHISTLDLMPPLSGYTDYYAAKGEDAGLGDPESWNGKQREVAGVLSKYAPKTVLDLGANTGWYSLLAARMGAYVTALDIDLSCIDTLYRTAKTSFPGSICPLWMSFDDLTAEHYSLDASGQTNENPLHMAATRRLNSDVVLCLALMHHLTLGLGLGLEKVLEVLFALTKRVLVLEFTDLDDPLIVADPSFFPNLAQWNADSYSREAVQNIALKSGFTCTVAPSTPAETRCLLILEKHE